LLLVRASLAVQVFDRQGSLVRSGSHGGTWCLLWTRFARLI
jgi:hypothetical protein